LPRLTNRGFISQINPDIGEREYLVQLPRDKFKRSRLARGEHTLYRDTSLYADLVLPGVALGVRVFPFSYSQAA